MQTIEQLQSLPAFRSKYGLHFPSSTQQQRSTSLEATATEVVSAPTDDIATVATFIETICSRVDELLADAPAGVQLPAAS